ncbi:Outer membrane cobalamin receptor protein [Sphingobacterium spiritivorum]|uniref:Outer membrane cobalamin receptor protein n=1 Tax=Sphingobacterium spiritivorum TaxID=258 RepID=A0A380BHN0_SPHSI|nr:TonB-dependent receptor [Sphingobacterium spiritivorum]SUJ01599.1 Outer membrane cobalamin receptor protein [Sphingobacterium spiritivorum]
MRSYQTLSTLCLFFLTNQLVAQETKLTDTVLNRLAPVQINAYFANQPLLSLTSSAKTLDSRLISSQNNSTFLTAINTVPGIRMEERSPGSYRLAMRGSLIRSPFGVRNTKIYLDEFPLTDAGGNTYFNLVDPAAVSSIHILKGPDGSVYGPNSGGVITIAPNGFDTGSGSSLLLQGGSFGLFQEQLSTKQLVNPNYRFAVDQSFTRSDGYRQNSALNKKTIQTAHQWDYSDKGQLKAIGFYADLGYRTPGGLTQAQYDENPKLARPAAGPNPGAADQKAGIYNKTFFGGLSNRYHITTHLTHVVSIFGSHSDIKNPFITNYEKRDEKNMGIRTYFSYADNSNQQLHWQMQLGLEAQNGRYKIDNYNNKGGVATDPQAKDDLKNGQHFYFLRSQVLVAQKLTLEGSLGLNYNTISYQNIFPVLADKWEKIDFENTWMPRFALSYLITPQMAIRSSVSKGLSAPTIAEVRSSDNIINRQLNPETGTNYEAGIRWETADRRVIADVSYYYYRMDNAIIRQIRENGAEYYLNAGKTDQKGLEASLSGYLIAPRTSGWVQSLSLSSNLTYNDYKFKAYQVGENDYSGNKLTAVPDWIWVNHTNIQFAQHIELNIMHNFTSRIPLNDANTAYGTKYHLLQAKLAWLCPINGKLQIQFFAGADNILDQKYSLGNDINAFGNRFFNAAPGRNYYGGLKISY